MFPSAEFYGNTVTDVLGRNLQCMYGDEHRVNRALVSPAFRQRLMPGLVPPLLEPVAHELIDRFEAAGEADLVADFTSRYPFIVITRLLGLPRHSEADIKRWAMGMLDIQNRYDNALRMLARVHGLRRPDPAGAAAEPGRRPHLHARDRRGGGPAPHRRGDLQLPPAALPRRRRHHLPRARLDAVLAAHAPRPARVRARGPRASGAGGPGRRRSGSTRRPRGSRASTRGRGLARPRDPGRHAGCSSA